jgi:DNA-binding CsgD family transcriptional regulator/PAS domain-containing protein
MAETRRLLGADQALLYLTDDSAGDGRDGAIQAWGQGPLAEEASRAYERYFYHVDPAPARRRALGLDVYHIDMLYTRLEFDRLEIGVDWSTRYRLFDTIGIDLLHGPPAGLCFHHESRSGSTFGERGLALLRLMRPAFEAGVHVSSRLAQDRASFARVLDDLGVALALFDGAGRVVHHTPRLLQLLSSDPEGARLRTRLTSLGAAATAALLVGRSRLEEAASAPRTHDVRTLLARYQLRVTYAGGAFPGTGVSVAVLVERVQPQPLSDRTLQKDYRLTPREIEVARLLAQGKTNLSIAEALGISSHTAERHTEHVLMKLGLRSRTEAVARLLGQ